jgi:hypothetical protein
VATDRLRPINDASCAASCTASNKAPRARGRVTQRAVKCGEPRHGCRGFRFTQIDRSGGNPCWRRGTKGRLSARFAAVRVRVADGPPQRIRDMGGQHMPRDEAWLIGERRATGEHKYYLSNLPTDTPITVLASTIKISAKVVLGGVASSHTHQPGRCLDRQPPIRQIVRHTKPRQLLFAHFDHRHRTPPRTSRTTACPVTSLSVIYTRASAGPFW